MERIELPRYCSDEPKWLHPLLSVTLIVSPCMYLPEFSFCLPLFFSVSPCFSFFLTIALLFSRALLRSLIHVLCSCLSTLYPPSLSLAAAKPSKA